MPRVFSFQTRDQKRRGFTLTELALVLVVIGSILAGIWYAAANTQAQRRVNDALVELQAVAQNINDTMQGRTFPSYTEYTSAYLDAGLIPSSYRNPANSATADSPWLPGQFKVYAINAKTYRLSFYGVTRGGCLGVVQQATNCQAGEVGCPTAVYTRAAAHSCQPNQTGCSGTVSATGIGWAVLTPTLADALCSYNDYNNGTTNNSLEFDYSL